MRNLKAVLTLIVVTSLVQSSSLWACAVCFGDPNSPLTRGIKMGILTLIAFVAVVLTAILGVALSWLKRARTMGSAQS